MEHTEKDLLETATSEKTDETSESNLNLVKEEKPGFSKETSSDVDDVMDESNESNDDEETDEFEDIDFSKLSLDELMLESKKLSEISDLKKAEFYLKSIKEEVDQTVEGLKEEAKKKFVAEGGEEDGFEFKPSAEISTFYSLFKDIRKRRKEEISKLNQEKDKNLKEKKAIIEKIKEFTDLPSRKAWEEVKDLQEKWKNIGPVPQPQAENLYKSYHAVLDIFYDHKSIEKDLIELDRQKNLEVKLDLCTRAEALVANENIKHSVNELNDLHKEYKETGPAPKGMQEELWQRFKAASDKIYDKKRAFIEDFKKELNHNMALKQELCLKTEPFSSFSSDRIKEWNAKTKEILEFQKEWEKIGAMPREVAKNINRQFWGNIKEFFNNKRSFFEVLDREREENLKKKVALCEAAESIMNSDDWNEAGKKLIELQKEWKEVGSVHRSKSDEVFNRFKKACDHFFERRRENRSSKETEFVDNYNQKAKICKEIEEGAKTKKELSYESLKKWKDSFFEIGFVPRNKINDIIENFLNACENYLNALSDKEITEQERVEFQSSLMKEFPSFTNRHEREERKVRQKIQGLRDDIALWENNLEFFSASTTAEKLKKEFNGKIEKAHATIEKLENQLKFFNKIDRLSKKPSNGKESNSGAEEEVEN